MRYKQGQSKQINSTQYITLKKLPCVGLTPMTLCSYNKAVVTDRSLQGVLQGSSQMHEDQRGM